MRTSDKTPSEVIDYIGDIIRERQQKSLPTFYTILIEQYDKATPVAEKEEGYENFKQQVLKYMSDYNLTSLTVQLFSGKSRNVKSPFQVFKVQLKKQNPTIVLGGFDKPVSDSENEVKQLESSIPVGRYYDEKFELQMRIMRNELEKQTLTERLHQLTERYEDKLKEQDKRYEEKIKLLDLEIQHLEQEIQDYEREIAKNEKDKHNSFGNIALGSISARAIENLAKSDLGTGLLKGLLGKEGYDNLQGHLAGIENEKKTLQNEPAARIISESSTEPANARNIAIAYISMTIQSLPDMQLRILYDITQLAEKNVSDLQVLWKVLQQINQQRGQSPTDKKYEAQSTTPGNEDSEEENEEEENNIS
ncbi:MAG TPA: hypothetical protein VLB84_01040 [Bacteroidia bacterium]|nr:hypothetical protein [Bacteroidia bacterium]